MKHTLKLIMLLSIITVTNSCKKNDLVPAAKNVYIAGAESNGTFSVATFWKNDVATHLADGTKKSFAYSIVVKGNDVYVAGFEIEDPSGHHTLKYWKNGVATTLSKSSSLAEFGSMIVVGKDVYVTGSEAENMGRVAKYWKNGIETKLTDGSNFAHAYSIAVSGNDVYIFGSESTASGVVTKFWKNTTAVNLPGFFSYPGGIVVVGNDVFVGGNQSNGTKKVAAHWKNGQIKSLSDGTKDAQLNAFTVDGDVVHAVGYEINSNGFRVGKYWNSTGASVNLSNGTNHVQAHAIAVYGNDVHICGDEADGFNGLNYTIAKFWKNAVETDIGSKTSGVVSNARGIFVTQ